MSSHHKFAQQLIQLTSATYAGKYFYVKTGKGNIIRKEFKYLLRSM